MSDLVAEVLLALKEAFDGDAIEVNMQGNHCHLAICSRVFIGMSSVKRQQRVYAVLSPWITSQQIHAVHFNLTVPN
jgi:acid stress-induced BolA-like protein IbaG/YrbA